jgi:CRISP-associated protein Cas1
MAFRTIEISNPAEIHIKSGQLIISQEDGIATIPIEDIAQIMTIGPGIRLSTMDLSILSQNKVSITTLDQKYLPTAIVLPFEGNARQSKLIHKQVETSNDKYTELWMEIIQRKICNQARALAIMGYDGAERVSKYAEDINPENVDYREAGAAKEYFTYYHEGLNRRNDDPINSRLNYGYAVVRSAIARGVVSAGFHPAFGIHHNSQLNPFNLVDDLIEPFRSMVDLVAHENIGTNERLTKAERYAMAGVLHNACIIKNVKMNALSAVVEMCESLKRIIYDGINESLALPRILPIERMEGITE